MKKILDKILATTLLKKTWYLLDSVQLLNRNGAH